MESDDQHREQEHQMSQVLPAHYRLKIRHHLTTVRTQTKRKSRRKKALLVVTTTLVWLLWPNPANAQVVDGVVVPLAADLAKKSTAKRTKDTKWTAAMEEKLVNAVYGLKTHANTDIAKYKKWDLVKAKLVSDRDFAAVEGLAEKSSQAFEVKFKSLMKSFVNSHSIDKEGANLSGLDGDTLSSFNRVDNALYAMALECWEQDDSKREKTEKEKNRNASMLTYEREGLSAQSVVPSDAVTDSPMEELTASS